MVTNEEIDLDEGLSKFRSGLELIKKCKSRLKEVENEFIEIKKEFKVDESINGNQSKQNINEKDEVTSEDIPF